MFKREPVHKTVRHDSRRTRGVKPVVLVGIKAHANGRWRKNVEEYSVPTLAVEHITWRTLLLVPIHADNGTDGLPINSRFWIKPIWRNIRKVSLSHSRARYYFRV